MMCDKEACVMADDIPDGWVPLSSFDERREKKRGGESGEYAALRKAIHEGLIDSRSLGRPKRWYVRRTQAEHYLNAHYRVANTPIDAGLEKRVDALSAAVRELKVMVFKMQEDLHKSRESAS
jgi:hypothetical protein